MTKLYSYPQCTKSAGDIKTQAPSTTPHLALDRSQKSLVVVLRGHTQAITCKSTIFVLTLAL